MDNDALKDAIIEAARHLVHKHVESWIHVDVPNNNKTTLEIIIHPNETTAYGAVFEEGDNPLPDTLFGALADLLGAVDAYDEWAAEVSGE